MAYIVTWLLCLGGYSDILIRYLRLAICRYHALLLKHFIEDLDCYKIEISIKLYKNYIKLKEFPEIIWLLPRDHWYLC